MHDRTRPAQLPPDLAKFFAAGRLWLQRYAPHELEKLIASRARKQARRQARERAGLPPRGYKRHTGLSEEQRAEHERELARARKRRHDAKKSGKPVLTGEARAYERLDDLTPEEKRERKRQQDHEAYIRRWQKRMRQKALAGLAVPAAAQEEQDKFTIEDIAEALKGFE